MLGDLSPIPYQLFRALSISPLALSPVSRFVDHTRPSFNLAISRVSGPARVMYLNGARLDGVYGASTLVGGQALNLTLTDRADSLDVGIVACRRSVPQFRRIPTHLKNSLADLERAVLP